MICRICKIDKPFDKFQNVSNSASKLSYCKECKNAAMKVDYAKKSKEKSVQKFVELRELLKDFIDACEMRDSKRLKRCVERAKVEAKTLRFYANKKSTESGDVDG